VRTERKKRLRKRDEKQSRQEVRKWQVLLRVLEFLGIQPLFDELPDEVINLFLDRIGPGIEVEAHPDSRDHPAIKEARRVIAGLIRRPMQSTLDGRPYTLAFEDIYRGYDIVVEGIRSFAKRFRGLNGLRANRVWVVMEEARGVVEALDSRWVEAVFDEVYAEIPELLEKTYRVHGPIIEARISPKVKHEGVACIQIELRRHPSEPQVVSYRGARWTAYACRRPAGLQGMRHTRWNCRRYGIEGPNVDLPVLISEHAIKRLHERLPLYDYNWVLHQLMVESLDRPVFLRQDVDEYLVETRMGRRRVGYFVAKILPHSVLIKTFLFLTMNGTPEGNALRSKIGLSRDKIEEYKLDNFFTLIGSDIVDDPFWSRMMHECGCGHLITMIGAPGRIGWSAVYGERLKKEFDLRESPGGFKVGQKWVRWNSAHTGPSAGEPRAIGTQVPTL
jgi:hypothetical protein